MKRLRNFILNIWFIKRIRDRNNILNMLDMYDVIQLRKKYIWRMRKLEILHLEARAINLKHGSERLKNFILNNEV